MAICRFGSWECTRAFVFAIENFDRVWGFGLHAWIVSLSLLCLGAWELGLDESRD